ncbi:hunchback [Halictus rubicundus]|uniref:hunchback n=1 Tax=Halictus rubicundus TaxID=77578 RepID=UPI0040365DB3
MPGNCWGTTGPLVHTLDQQHQQQQQQQQHSIAEEQHQPLHSSATTPVWGIADITVKEEPMEDKNNDSGVSPDHYTSSTANSSFSPSSATSQDSNTMQCSTFDYASQGMYKNCVSLADQAMDIVSSSVKSSIESTMFDDEMLQCPVCAFVTFNRINVKTLKIFLEFGPTCQEKKYVPPASCKAVNADDIDFADRVWIISISVVIITGNFTSIFRVTFSEHLSLHCTNKNDAPEFEKNVLKQLMSSGSQPVCTRSSPIQTERSEKEREETEEPGLRVPRVNSQGKVKTFRCKQCSFVAITKLEFWNHSRIHIKAEKLLTCPKCPFVTEYKHHLEYHLRNHFGSKPYKCELCTYSCVNKSMLNSHLKSHSNVYQYRCANCSYATKYCHSLKLHLRKYSHLPAMVLNADGSPNPLPIIDVYGTRRGPKQKPIKQKQQKKNADQKGKAATKGNVQSSSPQVASSAQIAPVVDSLPTNPVNGINGTNNMNGANSMNSVNSINEMNAMNAMNTMNTMNAMNAMNTMNAMNAMNGMSPIGALTAVVSNQPMMPFPYNQLFPGFPLGQFPATSDSSAEKQLEQLKSTALMDYAKSVGGEGIEQEMPQNLVMKCCDDENKTAGNEAAKDTEMLYSPVQEEPQNLEAKAVPLDLSKPSTANRVQNKPTVNSLKATGTSRRKGKAVRLDRRMVEEDTDEEQHQRPRQYHLAMQQKRQPKNKMEPSTSNGPSSSRSSPSSPSSSRSSPSGPSTSRSSSSGPSTSGYGTSGYGTSGPSTSRPTTSGFDFSGLHFSCPSTSGLHFGCPSTSGLNPNGPSTSGLNPNGPNSRDPNSSGQNSNGPSSSGAVDDDNDCSNEFNCRYCEIGFGNVVMYTVHMGYHGYSDPYTCNMCGYKCTEKVSFFLHIARSKHT